VPATPELAQRLRQLGDIRCDPRASSFVSSLAAERRPGFSSNTRSFGPSIALVPSERLSCTLGDAIMMKLRILRLLPAIGLCASPRAGIASAGRTVTPVSVCA
jgi:hypothetical protein